MLDTDQLAECCSNIVAPTIYAGLGSAIHEIV
jgi:hypothetical protein